MKLFAGTLSIFCWFMGGLLGFYGKDYLIGGMLIACAITLVIIAEKAKV